MKTGSRAEIAYALREAMDLGKFRDWLVTQPSAKTYVYSSPCHCAVTEYLQSFQFSMVSSSCGSVCAFTSPRTGDGAAVRIDVPIVFDRLSQEGPRMYGFLLNRVNRELLNQSYREEARTRSTTVVPAAHNGLVEGSTPSESTSSPTKEAHADQADT